eukprot:Plantae.Rhodophyta-Purpureofilum_apyrenoidigerum.ctg1630.p1 GENE.Plantae.Rhodophyta-Purpureofilum_apyrenoidigerum.ctg1630~~Plantae.Rhodophyta-Purpureofilum_apyrenoidigerum.ctg1630.p1  ORF type:complete len:486 (-),score=74.30 Plantae.Rhodophyta-Purpureofilum_apyrenoidigerum.ctg1630:110-1567(-)
MSTNIAARPDEDDDADAVYLSLTSPLLSRFDVVLTLRDPKDSQDWDKRLSSFILNGRCGNNEREMSQREEQWPAHKLQLYLHHVKKSISPELSDNAQLLLSTYYSAERASERRNAARTTVRLLESLIRLTQAHARLMLRKLAVVQDGLFAIAAVETSAVNASVLGGRLGTLHGLFPQDPEADYRNFAQHIIVKLGLEGKIDAFEGYNASTESSQSAGQQDQSSDVLEGLDNLTGSASSPSPAYDSLPMQGEGEASTRDKGQVIESQSNDITDNAGGNRAKNFVNDQPKSKKVVLSADERAKILGENVVTQNRYISSKPKVTKNVEERVKESNLDTVGGKSKKRVRGEDVLAAFTRNRPRANGGGSSLHVVEDARNVGLSHGTERVDSHENLSPIQKETADVERAELVEEEDRASSLLSVQRQLNAQRNALQNSTAGQRIETTPQNPPESSPLIRIDATDVQMQNADDPWKVLTAQDDDFGDDLWG